MCINYKSLVDFFWCQNWLIAQLTPWMCQCGSELTGNTLTTLRVRWQAGFSLGLVMSVMSIAKLHLASTSCTECQSRSYIHTCPGWQKTPLGNIYKWLELTLDNMIGFYTFIKETDIILTRFHVWSILERNRERKKKKKVTKKGIKGGTKGGTNEGMEEWREKKGRIKEGTKEETTEGMKEVGDSYSQLSIFLPIKSAFTIQISFTVLALGKTWHWRCTLLNEAQGLSSLLGTDRMWVTHILPDLSVYACEQTPPPTQSALGGKPRARLGRGHRSKVNVLFWPENPL